MRLRSVRARAGRNSTSDAADSDGEVLAVTMTVPGPGLLIADGVIEVEFISDTEMNCQLSVDAVAIPDTDVIVGPGAGNWAPCVTGGTKFVPSAGSYTVRLDTTFVLNAAHNLFDSTLDVLYVPGPASSFPGAG
jgi:hypothetical protein